MEFFDRIRSMPIQRQIVLVAGIVAIVGFVLGSVYFVFLHQPDSVLFANLRPMDAATIVGELDKRKAAYHLAKGGTTILVPANQVDATRLSILSQDLPLKGAVGFELFNKSDIGLTEFAQKINYQRALQGELARTIMALDAVDTARVHLSLPEPTIFRDDRRAPKASIAITLKPDKSLASGAVLGIQRLVAAAVSDLDIANVVVVDGEGQIISSDMPSEGSDAESPTQRAAEIYYTSKIREALGAAYPGHDLTVKVAATSAFGVHVAPGEAGEPSEIATASADPFSGWTPEFRTFRLRVDIVSAAAPNATVQQTLRAAVADAIGANPALGDTITVTSPEFVMAGAPEDAPVSSVPEETHGRPAASSSTAAIVPYQISWGSFWIGVLLLSALGIAFSGSKLFKLSRPARKLTEAERRDFANRFQALLDRGEGDATHHF